MSLGNWVKDHWWLAPLLLGAQFVPGVIPAEAGLFGGGGGAGAGAGAAGLGSAGIGDAVRAAGAGAVGGATAGSEGGLMGLLAAHPAWAAFLKGAGTQGAQMGMGALARPKPPQTQVQQQNPWDGGWGATPETASALAEIMRRFQQQVPTDYTGGY
jgi:hypothetical protein